MELRAKLPTTNPSNGMNSMMTARKILVIDDDDDLRQSLLEQLELGDEFKVVTAESGAEGIDLVKSALPDGVHPRGWTGSGC
jgi:ActR/RegA family two-component response regulator